MHYLYLTTFSQSLQPLAVSYNSHLSAYLMVFMNSLLCHKLILVVIIATVKKAYAYNLDNLLEASI
jgi:hypothetical protein